MSFYRMNSKTVYEVNTKLDGIGDVIYQWHTPASFDTYCPEKHHWVLRFGNHRGACGASIITENGSEYELAVLYFPYAVGEEIIGKEYILDYNTEITDDVIGHAPFDYIMETLERIKNLDPDPKKRYVENDRDRFYKELLEMED